MNKSCKTCKFWLAEEPATDNPEDIRWGICRRYPPPVSLREPSTPEEYWCGEWKQKEDVA